MALLDEHDKHLRQERELVIKFASGHSSSEDFAGGFFYLVTSVGLVQTTSN